MVSSITAGSGAELGAESRAVKGSLVLGLRGEGLGLAARSCALFTGLPRLIGVMSGITALSSVGGAA